MRTPFMPEILARLAPQLGAEVILEPEYRFVGLIRFPNGAKSYFWENKFNLNSISAVRVAQDKGYTYHFLRFHGYWIPRTRTFFRDDFRCLIGSTAGVEEASRFAAQLGWPVIVKPCRRSQGRGVTLVTCEKELFDAAQRILERDRMMLVQQVCTGRDYRIVVLDGEVISAYERVPLTVTGDGHSSIRELLQKLQQTFENTGRDTHIPLDDPRIKLRLQRYGRNLDTVPAGHEKVQVIDIANLSLGGTTIDITDRLHPSFAYLATSIANDMDLRFAGIDLMAADATIPVRSYHVLEVNSAPGLDHYGSSGPEHQARVDSLYLKLLKAVACGPHQQRKIMPPDA